MGEKCVPGGWHMFRLEFVVCSKEPLTLKHVQFFDLCLEYVSGWVSELPRRGEIHSKGTIAHWRSQDLCSSGGGMWVLAVRQNWSQWSQTLSGRLAQVLAASLSPGGFVQIDRWVPPLSFQWKGSGPSPRTWVSSSSSDDAPAAGLVTMLGHCYPMNWGGNAGTRQACLGAVTESVPQGKGQFQYGVSCWSLGVVSRCGPHPFLWAFLGIK